MRTYEILFIMHPDSDEEKIASVVKRYHDVIASGKGTVKSSEKWGKRRLAYEIDGLREGLYYLMTFEADPKVSHEIDRLMKIDQDVVRHMITRMDHPLRRTAPRPQRTRVEEGKADASESGPEAQTPREQAGAEPARKTESVPAGEF